jgi:hypothetical protein
MSRVMTIARQVTSNSVEILATNSGYPGVVATSKSPLDHYVASLSVSG